MKLKLRDKPKGRKGTSHQVRKVVRHVDRKRELKKRGYDYE